MNAVRFPDRFRSLILVLAIAPICEARAPVPRVDYQKKADTATWEWSDRKANIGYSVEKFKGAYGLQIESRGKSITIRITKDDKPIYSWRGHPGSVFVANDGIVYRADYDPLRDGCAIIAFDLRRGKQLWKTDLKRLGLVNYTEVYHSEVALEIYRSALCVHGKEDAGNYIEYIDLASGKTVGHRIFESK